MEMQRIKDMLQNDDSAVSPVIGVILMVAITVILAAVIASFVLGLGDQGEPAPQPTIDSSVDTGNITLDVTGGDAFSASDSTIEGEIDGNPFSVDLDSAPVDELSAGDTIVVNSTAPTASATQAVYVNGQQVDTISVGADPATTEWEVQIIWNPSDQDSQIIYEDSS
ncbi:type IV pilin [Halovenus carboxidivorans]|uniref:type IV pilin n=1 Tax=Halovenus carboxidivorans TaxID=2692199 RepID=UPI001F262FD0|nr:type IV pilin N-terminal domain-containing protein [Halovenus carboxidivorans]